MKAGDVFLDITCVRVPSARVATALTPWRPKQGVLLSEADARALVSAWKSDSAVETVVLTKILALDGQEASVFEVEEYRPEVEPARSAALTFIRPEDDPNRKWKGVSFSVVPHIDFGAKAIDITMNGRWREPLHPEATNVDGLGLQGTQVSANFRLPLDGYALLVSDGSIQHDGRTYEVATLVHGHILAEQSR